MNLMINGIDAMKDVDGARELAIKSQRAENEATAGLSQRYRRGTSPAAGGPDLQWRFLPPNLTAPAMGTSHQPLHRRIT